MRVAVDATSLLTPRTGVGMVTMNLLHGLGARDDVDVVAFSVSARGRGRLPSVLPPGVPAVGVPMPARLVRPLWRRFDRPRVDRIVGRPDVVHSPNFVVPPARAARVASVHDLTPLRFPELCDPATLAYPALIRRAVDTGAWLATGTEAVRAEILDAFPVAPHRVRVTPYGANPLPPGDAHAGRRVAGVDRYVLAVGTVEPRKDLPSLIRAIDRIPGPDAPVVVHAGGAGWGIDEFEAVARSMAHPDRLRRVGRVSDATLADLYAAATLCVYPSVYEGFGLPVLEAMAAGVPVVATADPSVAEVAGDAAVLVPIGDVDALAEAITDVWTDDGRRASLVVRGRRRVADFGWDRFIDTTVALYRDAVDDGR